MSCGSCCWNTYCLPGAIPNPPEALHSVMEQSLWLSSTTAFSIIQTLRAFCLAGFSHRYEKNLLHASSTRILVPGKDKGFNPTDFPLKSRYTSETSNFGSPWKGKILGKPNFEDYQNQGEEGREMALKIVAIGPVFDDCF